MNQYTGRNSFGSAPTLTEQKKQGENMGLWGSALATGANIFTSIYNAKKQEQANDLNWERTKELNAEMYAREDTAHQREVADLQKAGLSPLAALGGASANAPLGYEATAPQMDLSQATGALMNMDTISAQKKALRSQESIARERNMTEEQIAARELNEKINEFKTTQTFMNKKLVQDLDKFKENLNFEQLKHFSKMFYDDLSRIENETGFHYERKFVTSSKEWTTEFNNYLQNQAYNDQEILKIIQNSDLIGDTAIREINELGGKLTGSADSGGDSNQGFNLAEFFKKIGKKLGISVSAEIDANSMTEIYRNMTQEQKIEFWKDLSRNPYFAGKMHTITLTDGSKMDINFRNMTVPMLVGWKDE